MDKWSTGFCHSRETIDLAFCPIPEHGGKQRQAYQRWGRSDTQGKTLTDLMNEDDRNGRLHEKAIDAVIGLLILGKGDTDDFDHNAKY